MSSIDVVVPCYRYAHYLRECVQSVLSQGIDDLRLLIIDDHSPDNTPEVGAALVHEDPRVSYLRHDVNVGHISTFNEGIDWTRADYMLLISADDYLLPGALQRAVHLMDSNADMGMCFGNAVVLHDNGDRRPMKVTVDTGGEPAIAVSGVNFVWLCARAGSSNVVATPTAIVKTSLLKRLGGYRADLPHTGDLELWLRLAAHGSVGFLNADQAVYRRHQGNMSTAYLQDHCATDLEQRKAAIDVFVQTCTSAMPQAPHLGKCLLANLGKEAVGQASAAFNSNRMELSRQLCDFAALVHPPVRRSWAWNTLVCKRLLGLRAARALRPAVTKLRVVTTKVRN
jgi:GT2 family glycosyltransferase